MLKTPDVTAAQIVALVQAVLAALVAFSVNLTDAQQAAILGLAAVIATLLVGSDAAIRRGRQKYLGGEK